MTQMSKAQRTAVLEAHNYSGDPRYRGIVTACHNPTLNVLRREGWMNSEYRITTAGLRAAGALDAIHTEALDEQARREMEAAADEQATPRYRHFLAAVIEGKSYRAALDILHAEAINEGRERLYARVHRGSMVGLPGLACTAERRGMATGSALRIAEINCPDCLAAIERAHAEALDIERRRGGAKVVRLGDNPMVQRAVARLNREFAANADALSAVLSEEPERANASVCPSCAAALDWTDDQTATCTECGDEWSNAQLHETFSAVLSEKPALKVITATAAHVTFSGFGASVSIHDANTGQKLGQCDKIHGFAHYTGVQGGAHEGVTAVIRGGVDGLVGALREGLRNGRDDRA